jgi:DNA-binding GntR family transcriptional regulator
MAAKALKVLVDEGLAEVVPGWGTYVTTPGE